jgi:hypothetical protein
VSFAWFDFLRLRERAIAYWRESSDLERLKTKTPGGA